jgi:hypothetical protein
MKRFTACWEPANFAGDGSFNTASAVDPNRKFVYANGNDGFVHKPPR